MARIKLREHPSQFDGVNEDISYHLMLLHDGARMRAYYNAIKRLSREYPKTERILDAGTGSGVWAIECAKSFPFAEIDAVDYHPEIVELARKQVSLWPELSDRIKVSQADLTKYKGRRKYDLIITELDGGIGNNEGCKRIFNNLKKRRKEDGRIIPAMIEIYFNPVEILKYDLLEDYLKPSETKASEINKSMYYLVSGLEIENILETNSVFDTCDGLSFDIFDTRGLNRENVHHKNLYKMERDGVLTGFITWFVHHLVSGLDDEYRVLDKKLVFSNSPATTTTSWGQAYFPVDAFKVNEGDKILLKFAEVITPAGPIPHYEWSVAKNGKMMGEYSNEKNQQRRR